MSISGGDVLLRSDPEFPLETDSVVFDQFSITDKGHELKSSNDRNHVM
jgi:hypothetical protein